MIHFPVVFVQLNEVFQLHATLRFHVRIVQIGVEHDNREAYAVGDVWINQNVVIDGLFVGVLCKGLHSTEKKRTTSMIRSIC